MPMALSGEPEVQESCRKDWPTLFGATMNLRQYEDRPCCADCNNLVITDTGERDPNGCSIDDYHCGLVPTEKFPFDLFGLQWMVCDKFELRQKGKQ